MSISDEELLSIPGVSAVEHFEVGELPRFWCDGAAHVLTKVGADPDTFLEGEEVVVPTMEIESLGAIESEMSGMLSSTRGEFGVTIVVRDGDVPEYGFVAASRLQRHVPKPSRSWAEAMAGGPREVSPFAQ